MGALVGQTDSSSPSKSRLQIQATICYKLLTLPLLALVDSGAEDNFLDNDVARQSGVALEPLEKPLVAHALDGKELAQVTPRTVPITLVLSGNHRENSSFNIMSTPRTPLLLGHPW